MHKLRDWRERRRQEKSIAGEFEDEPLDPRIRQFKHTPIDIHRQIRVLRFHSNDEGSGLRCSFETVEPGTAEYAALSYTWGEDGLEKTIICNGANMKITKNCHDALLAFQGHIGTHLWVDALCIDQSNPQERAVQVSRMGDIYSCAQTVYGYPGNEYMGYGLIRNRYIEGFTVGDFFDGRQKAIPEGLQKSPWLWRTWVMQEIMLARRLAVFVDINVAMDWSDLVFRSVSQMVLMRAQLRQEYAAPVPVASSQAKSSNMNLQWWRLFELLMETRDFGCRDRRDKVFGLVSLFQRPIPAQLFPDYEKSVREVYTDTSWFMINYDIPESLSLAGITQANGEMPSWTTNWSFKPTLRPLEGSKYGETWRAGFPADSRYIQAVRENDHIVIFRGVLVDHVTGIHTGVDQRALMTDKFASILESLRTRYSYASKSNFDATQDSPRGAFSTSLCHDCLGPDSVQHGDQICILLGYRTPFVIRQHGDDWLLVGQCYIENIMQGEFADGLDWNAANASPPIAPFVDFRFH